MSVAKRNCVESIGTLIRIRSRLDFLIRYHKIGGTERSLHTGQWTTGAGRRMLNIQAPRALQAYSSGRQKVGKILEAPVTMFSCRETVQLT